MISSASAGLANLGGGKATTSHPAGYTDPTMYYLHVAVQNLCQGDSLIGEMVADLEVRVQALSPFAIPPWGDEDYQNLTNPAADGWTQIDRADGLDLDIPSLFAVGLSQEQRLRIQVRNVDPDFKSLSYAIAIALDDNGVWLHVLDPEVKAWPWDKIVYPITDVQVDLAAGEVRSFEPTEEGIWDAYSLFFAPDPGYGNALSVTDFVLTTPEGRVPADPQGVPLAPTVYRDGGLSIPLGALTPQAGPYQARLATDAERIEGRVFLCGPNVADCATYQPRIQACGLACTGNGARCCTDDNRNLYCANVRGSDVTNCGGCGATCDWNEKCLKGVCVTGNATSCWNTTCPSGMECVSKSLPWLTNPECRATMVDNDWCGWFGDVCADSETCSFGLCLPKLGVECDLDCGDGEACCWEMGEETCVDTASGDFNCGGCGNV